MTDFLARTRTFLLVLSVAALASVALNLLLWPAHRPAGLDRAPELLLLGDSHLAFSIDPGRLRGAVSLAHPAELTILTARKLDLIYASGVEPRAILLSLGPHNVAAGWEEHVLAHPEWRQGTLETYFGLIPWRDLTPRIQAKVGVTTVAREWLTPNLHLLRDAWDRAQGQTPEESYLGGFQPQDRGMGLTSEALERFVARYFRPLEHRSPVSAVEIRAVRRIVQTATDRGIEVILYQAPVRPEFRSQIPHQIVAAFEQLLGELSQLPGVRVVDLSRLSLSDDRWMNFDHVRRSAVAEVTDSLRNALERTGVTTRSDETR